MASAPAQRPGQTGATQIRGSRLSRKLYQHGVVDDGVLIEDGWQAGRDPRVRMLGSRLAPSDGRGVLYWLQNAQRAEATAALALERLPLDFTTRTLRALPELTRNDLDAAYRRVATGEWTVVLVGDAGTIVSALEGRVTGPVVTVDL